jgi:hypothetical protein
VKPRPVVTSPPLAQEQLSEACDIFRRPTILVPSPEAAPHRVRVQGVDSYEIKVRAPRGSVRKRTEWLIISLLLREGWKLGRRVPT